MKFLKTAIGRLPKTQQKEAKALIDRGVRLVREFNDLEREMDSPIGNPSKAWKRQNADLDAYASRAVAARPEILSRQEIEARALTRRKYMKQRRQTVLHEIVATSREIAGLVVPVLREAVKELKAAHDALAEPWGAPTSDYGDVDFLDARAKDLDLLARSAMPVLTKLPSGATHSAAPACGLSLVTTLSRL